MLTESKIREIFFHSGHPRVGAVLATDIDYIQFAEKLEKAVEYEKTERAYREAISFVSSLNENVGAQLNGWAEEKLKKYR
jgi:hypothetical protein